MFGDLTELWNGSQYHRSNEYNAITCCVCWKKTCSRKMIFFCRVRSIRLSTVQLLVARGADCNLANNRGETATSIAEYLQPDQQQHFINALMRKYRSILLFTLLSIYPNRK